MKRAVQVQQRQPESRQRPGQGVPQETVVSWPSAASACNKMKGNSSEFPNCVAVRSK
jgi:hypothetical protein